MAFDITVTGRGAHAGVEPEKGISAIRIASEIIGDLPNGRLDEETTFNVGLISGGTVRNAVPVEVTFGGEFRSKNTETVDLLGLQVTEALNKARAKYQEAVIKEEMEMLFQMYTLDPNEPVVRMVTGMLNDMDLMPDIKPSGGGTDANQMRLNGIDCIVVGMATNEMHTVDEYVVVPDLMATARLCQNIMNPNQ
jgi:tripeptide aminopeptidase